MTLPASQLAPVLRSLRLTGMLEILDARLPEARAGTLGHVELLQVLCQDELARRDASAMVIGAVLVPGAATPRRLLMLRFLTYANWPIWG